MNDCGILLSGPDEVIESRAKRHSVALQVGEGLAPAFGEGTALPFEKTLITVPGVRVPWDLLPAAWEFLERWDAAVPLWRYDVTAASVGTAGEREITRLVIRDLRVLLHAVELLFVRRNEAGEKLMHTWRLQMQVGDGDQRLDFLRAVYIEKPRLCVLPVSWLVEVRAVNVRSWNERPRPINAGKPLVNVELEPGRFVKVHEGDQERVLAAFGRQRGKKNIMATVSSKSFELVNEKVRRSKGPLVKVEIAPGRFVKMYEADAIAQGHIEPKSKPASQDKSLPPAGDKMQPPIGDKAGDTPAADTVEDGDASDAAGGDDLTVIEGVGKATARALAAAGVVSFADLRALSSADLDKIVASMSVREAIEKWQGDEDEN